MRKLAITTATSDATPIIARPKQTSPAIEYEEKSGWSINAVLLSKTGGSASERSHHHCHGLRDDEAMLPCPGSDTWSILTAFGKVRSAILLGERSYRLRGMIW